MNKQFLIVVAVIILGLFGVLMLTKDNGSSDGSSDGNTTAEVSNHIVGNETSTVSLIEYGDFQCPACKAYFPIVDQIKQEYKDKIKFQFRHFPLINIHPNAFIASRAAEAAAKQGMFYEMHDLLYERQDSWSTSSDPTETFVAYANELNMNGEKLRADMVTTEVGDIINADVKAAQAAGATGTPSFVLNGELIETPRSLDDFKVILDEAIKNSAQNQQ